MRLTGQRKWWRSLQLSEVRELVLFSTQVIHWFLFGQLLYCINQCFILKIKRASNVVLHWSWTESSGENRVGCLLCPHQECQMTLMDWTPGFLSWLLWACQQIPSPPLIPFQGTTLKRWSSVTWLYLCRESPPLLRCAFKIKKRLFHLTSPLLGLHLLKCLGMFPWLRGKAKAPDRSWISLL